MDAINQLLYSYVRTTVQYERTGEHSYKKTLGMFRMRLKDQGIIVKDIIEDGNDFLLELEVNGLKKQERMPKPAGL